MSDMNRSFFGSTPEFHARYSAQYFQKNRLLRPILEAIRSAVYIGHGTPLYPIRRATVRLRLSQGDAPDEIEGLIGGKRLHERARSYVTVEARKWIPAQVARPTRRG